MAGLLARRCVESTFKIIFIWTGGLNCSAGLYTFLGDEAPGFLRFRGGSCL
jgi:hypothetical protein